MSWVVHLCLWLPSICWGAIILPPMVAPAWYRMPAEILWLGQRLTLSAGCCSGMITSTIVRGLRLDRLYSTSVASTVEVI